MPPPLAVNRCVLTVNARGVRIHVDPGRLLGERGGESIPGDFDMLVPRRTLKICHSKRFGAVLRLAIHLNRVRQRRTVTTFRVHRTSSRSTSNPDSEWKSSFELARI